MMNNDIIYLGIVGAAGSGKDELCKMIMDNVGEHVMPHRVAMADTMKRVVSDLYGIPLFAFYDRKVKEEIIPSYDMSPRDIMQQFGTEVIRNMDPDFWVKRMDQEVRDVVLGYKSPDGMYDSTNTNPEYNYPTEKSKRYDRPDANIDLVIIPDIRFPNEQEMVYDHNGMIIQITREDLDVGDIDFSHASETSIDTKLVDYHIENNRSLANLYLEALAFLNHHGLR